MVGTRKKSICHDEGGVLTKKGPWQKPLQSTSDSGDRSKDGTFFSKNSFMNFVSYKKFKLTEISCSISSTVMVSTLDLYEQEISVN